jgi:hypothetical protein
MSNNTTTKQIIASMLTENTGRALCDSGGYPKYDKSGHYVGSTYGYGRAFERNQDVDFEKLPSTTTRFSVRVGRLEIEMEHNVYHWLAQRCEIDTKLDAIFHGEFLKENDPENSKNWLELMDAFPDWVAQWVTWDYDVTSADQEESCDDVYFEVGGVYGEGKPFCVNTYNNEDMLSQVIRYVYFTWDKEEYVVLQIHGGADVRGGYSTPHVFKCGEYNETAILDNAKGHVFCTGKDHHPAALKINEFQESQLALPGVNASRIDFDNCNATWYTDDSCNFYSDGCCGSSHTNLEDMEAIDLAIEEEDAGDEVDDSDGPKPGDWRPGVVCVLDHVAYCPKCGARLMGTD